MREKLLLALKNRANSRGLVLASEATLVMTLASTSEAIRTALSELEKDGVIEILSRPPFLVARISSVWSARTSERSQTGPKQAPVVNPAHSFQSSLSQSEQMKESYRRYPLDESLLQEVLATLGETDPTTFRGAIRSYAPEIIRKALERIRRIPSVRKNRTALFRYLLPRIAKEPRPPN